jgi:hypothetical protein
MQVLTVWHGPLVQVVTLAGHAVHVQHYQTNDHPVIHDIYHNYTSGSDIPTMAQNHVTLVDF